MLLLLALEYTLIKDLLKCCLSNNVEIHNNPRSRNVEFEVSKLLTMQIGIKLKLLTMFSVLLKRPK